MKTLTLKEAYALATPGPLFTDRSDGTIYSRDGTIVAECHGPNIVSKKCEKQTNIHVLAHAFNVLPEAAAALDLINSLSFVDGCSQQSMLRGINEMRHAAKKALTKINTIQIP